MDTVRTSSIALFILLDTAMAKNPGDGQWYGFDDDSIMPAQVTWLEGIKSSAYILFYKKKTMDSMSHH